MSKEGSERGQDEEGSEASAKKSSIQAILRSQCNSVDDRGVGVARAAGNAAERHVAREAGKGLLKRLSFWPSSMTTRCHGGARSAMRVELDAMRTWCCGIATLVGLAGCGCAGLVSLDTNATRDAGPPDGPSRLVTDSGSSGKVACEAAVSGLQTPSCAPRGPGMTNCGSCSESCCASLEVSGGTFFRSYENSGSGPTAEADPATVSTFRLDKFDTTVEIWSGVVDRPWT
jgi:hypothetical protein